MCMQNFQPTLGGRRGETVESEELGEQQRFHRNGGQQMIPLAGRTEGGLDILVSLSLTNT